MTQLKFEKRNNKNVLGKNEFITEVTDPEQKKEFELKG